MHNSLRLDELQNPLFFPLPQWTLFLDKIGDCYVLLHLLRALCCPSFEADKHYEHQVGESEMGMKFNLS